MEQFKSLEDLRDALKRLSQWFARPIVDGEHPTLHLNPGSTHREVLNGIQRDDYIFSSCGNWVQPSIAHGLSFSAHWQHLKGIQRMKAKRNPGKPVSVYWILEVADIPEGLKFVPDPTDRKKQHYLLAVTQKMHVAELRSKLEWIADRMAVIKDAQEAL
ncbi:hypothetical protein [Simiduia agarivorans]|uniref:Uncharacterized protein n=1 Tax=Simiduia agarivorans (strain DSM 21679 / JCM 13881 / BCRC 17597 / SA1) TaxID=1117647 RepID=K4KEC2_SIMAS|nr:hypothetical protein [Simiduia agarivorans]AFU97256.1 hypothetical protein M5M_00085 [Simiduia agarivorans SA1 = DSM 21679]